MSLSVFIRLSRRKSRFYVRKSARDGYCHIKTHIASSWDDKMCIVGLHASVLSYNTGLTRLRLDGILLCEAGFK